MRLFYAILVYLASARHTTTRLLASSQHSRMNPSQLSVVSWNIDGLSGLHTSLRAKRAAQTILTQSPDLIFLQECIDENVIIFTDIFTKHGYKTFESTPSNKGYFTFCYVKDSPDISSVQLQRIQFLDEGRSFMGRDILCCELKVGNVMCFCLSTHLESLKDSTQVRIQQLAQILAIMMKYKGNAFVAGDLNIRNAEIKPAFDAACTRVRSTLTASATSTSVQPSELSQPFILQDAWEVTGKNNQHKNTWRAPENPDVTCRFDRVLYLQSLSMYVSEFSLIGKKMVPSIKTTPSDHFGMAFQVTLLPLSSAQRVSEEVLNQQASKTGLGDDDSLLTPKARMKSASVEAEEVSAAVSSTKESSIASSIAASETRLEALTVKELKALLKEKGLTVSGLKADLVLRLSEVKHLGKEG